MKTPLLTLFCLIMATTVVAMPYWPSVNGAAFEYSDKTVTVYTSGATFVRGWTDGGGSVWFSYADHYARDADGDLVVTGQSSMCSACTSPSETYFDPPWKLLDYPLTPGKRWSTTYAQFNPQENPFFYPDLIVTVEVVRETTVETPWGTLPVVELGFYRARADRPQDYEMSSMLLHVDLGPIEGLVGYSGVVPNTGISWGDLKALFR